MQFIVQLARLSCVSRVHAGASGLVCDPTPAGWFPDQLRSRARAGDATAAYNLGFFYRDHPTDAAGGWRHAEQARGARSAGGWQWWMP